MTTSTHFNTVLSHIKYMKTYKYSNVDEVISRHGLLAIRYENSDGVSARAIFFRPQKGTWSKQGTRFNVSTLFGIVPTSWWRTSQVEVVLDNLYNLSSSNYSINELKDAITDLVFHCWNHAADPERAMLGKAYRSLRSARE